MTAEESIRTAMIDLENKEELLSLYLSHAQDLDANTNLLAEDDITTISLSSWLALSPLDLLQRLLSVDGGDVATLARSLTQSEKLTHDQIQGYLCQYRKVDTFIGYCSYYVTEVLSGDDKSEVFSFTSFVLDMCYQSNQGEEWRSHDFVECLMMCINVLEKNTFVLNDDDLLTQVKECERVLWNVKAGETIHECYRVTMLQIRDWMREDMSWVQSRKEDCQCSTLSLEDLHTLLKRPSVRYLQTIASNQLQHMTSYSMIQYLQTLLQKSFPFLPSDIVPYLLLSVLLQVGSNDSLNAVNRLTRSLRKDFIQETVLQVVKESILSLNRCFISH